VAAQLRFHNSCRPLFVIRRVKFWSCSPEVQTERRKFLRAHQGFRFFFCADDDEFTASILEIEWLYSLAASPEKRLAHYITGGHGADMFPVTPTCPKKSWTGSGHAAEDRERLPVRKRFQRFPRKSKSSTQLISPEGPLRFRRCSNNHVNQSSKPTLFFGSSAST